MITMESSFQAGAEFRVLTAQNGAPTARHLDTFTLVHSRVDPYREAEDVVSSMWKNGKDSIVLIGGGLGYLAEALLTRLEPKGVVTVIEPDVALSALARQHRPQSAYVLSNRIRVAVATTFLTLARRFAEVPAAGGWIVAPYLLRIARHRNDPLSRLILLQHAEHLAMPVYNELLAKNESVNSERLKTLPLATSVRLPLGKRVAVVGAGPSLDSCVAVLREEREKLVIVAASGAVPPLLAANITPDWVIAMEAKDVIAADLKALPGSSRLVVFPSTCPDVLESCRQTMYAGCRETGDALQTRGGTTMIPALDFALRASSEDVILIGVDLHHEIGCYSAFANRKGAEAETPNVSPPKFAVMRSALERVMAERSSPGRSIIHVLERGPELRGAIRATPVELEAWMARGAATERSHAR